MTVTTEALGSARVIRWDNQRHRNAWRRHDRRDRRRARGRHPDPAVRCVVARGAGEDFSAGDDLFEAAEGDAESFAPRSTSSSASHASCSTRPCR